MSKKVFISQEEYYQFLKMIGSIPVILDNCETVKSLRDRESIVSVQDTLHAVYAKLLKIGDDQLIPRVNRVVDEERRKADRRNFDDSDYTLQQHKEYLQQVREENS